MDHGPTLFSFALAAACAILGVIEVTVLLILGHAESAWIIGSWLMLGAFVGFVLGAAFHLNRNRTPDNLSGVPNVRRGSEEDLLARRSNDALGAWGFLFDVAERTKPGPDATTEEVLAWSERMRKATENMQRDLKARRDAGL